MFVEGNISNQCLQHFYVEVLKTPCEDLELVKEHYDNEMTEWYETENERDIRLVEKYVQTDVKIVNK